MLCNHQLSLFHRLSASHVLRLDMLHFSPVSFFVSASTLAAHVSRLTHASLEPSKSTNSSRLTRASTSSRGAAAEGDLSSAYRAVQRREARPVSAEMDGAHSQQAGGYVYAGLTMDSKCGRAPGRSTRLAVSPSRACSRPACPSLFPLQLATPPSATSCNGRHRRLRSRHCRLRGRCSLALPCQSWPRVPNCRGRPRLP